MNAETSTAEAPLVRCLGAGRSYGRGTTAVVALQPTDCEVPPHAGIALIGPSGSGKSTLLHLMAGIDAPTVGTITWPAIGSRDELRPGPVAMVFQGPSLLPTLNVEENVALPLLLDGQDDETAHARARIVLEGLGLSDLNEKLPDEISGGQAQRVAVARAISGRPRLILADEPTGQLDRASGSEVVDALVMSAEAYGAALVVATHDPTVAAQLPSQWEMRNGRLEQKTKARELAWSR
ncbi:MAG TPA: ABC transporter ATP-binding protein [Solirubrobacterales bacterium]|jgi:putative ABC transport system ATP-binding protein/lipoprotein-releasing system ATP-binding protein|nr:ABC transporter ATP-binding protein [Solirubrobacterales bacterium]